MDGRPLRPQPIVADLVVTRSEFGSALGDGLKRIEPIDDEVQVVTDGPFAVHYHDIDQYRHVNNAAYVEWVADAVDAEHSMSHEVAALEIDFLRETLLGDTCTVRLSDDPASPATRFEVLRTSDDQASARGRITWRPIVADL